MRTGKVYKNLQKECNPARVPQPQQQLLPPPPPPPDPLHVQALAKTCADFHSNPRIDPLSGQVISQYGVIYNRLVRDCGDPSIFRTTYRNQLPPQPLYTPQFYRPQQSLPPQPRQPRQPRQPVQPVQPTQPDQPAQPGQPIQPDQPAQPTQPTQPDQPAQPGQPIQPEQPAQPGQPIQPEQPAQPGQPIQPPQPAQPVQPPQPAQPAQPAQPPIHQHVHTNIQYPDVYDYVPERRRQRRRRMRNIPSSVSTDDDDDIPPYRLRRFTEEPDVHGRYGLSAPPAPPVLSDFLEDPRYELSAPPAPPVLSEFLSPPPPQQPFRAYPAVEEEEEGPRLNSPWPLLRNSDSNNLSINIDTAADDRGASHVGGFLQGLLMVILAVPVGYIIGLTSVLSSSSKK